MPSSKTSNSMLAKRVLISGKVQGVGFRYALADLARDMNIQGWCRNLPSGEVEVSIQGETLQVEKLLTWLSQGPPSAMVAQVMIEDQAILEPLLGESIQTFEIRK
jgi:acylphosphatase